jgi:hypothetical protein
MPRLGAGRDVRHGLPQGGHLTPDECQARFVTHVDDQHAPFREECSGFLVEPGAGDVRGRIRAGEDVQDDDV